MAIAIQQATTPDFLLNQWRGQGWSVIRSSVVSQVPVSMTTGQLLIQTQLDAFEWKDVTLFGVGNVDDALAKLAAYIRQGGSQLHSYALFKRTDFDFLGVKVVSYRLLLYHSVVQMAAVYVVAILAIAFAALLFLQYTTTGQPPITAIKNLWGGILRPVQDAVTGTIGTATQGIGNVWILAIVGAGAISLAFGMASKSTGVKIREPKGPGGSVGFRAGPASARVSS